MSENKILLNSFLNRTFFKDFNSNKNETKLFDNLELMIKSKCNLNCKYCYYNDKIGYGNDLNPESIATEKNIMENTDSLLSWLTANEYVPGRIEIFSGEPLIYDFVYDIIDKCIDFYSDFDKKGSIIIPTNMSFIRNDKKVEKIIKLKNKAKFKKVGLGLSASIDGIFMDPINRPIGNSSRQEKLYNEEYYNKIFQFAKDVKCGFHPMIYYNNIEKWKDNFDWFQSKFAEFGLPWYNIYLLEVRNDGWTKESIHEYKEFYKYALNFAFEKFKKQKNDFIDKFISEKNNMNLFNNIGKIGRGIGCSLQTTMFVRMGDLVVSPCHRQSYDKFSGFKFVKDNSGKIYDLEPLNLEYYLATISLDNKTLPYCETCLIKNICMGGCLGAQYEYMGDSFTPIPSVCALKHGKIMAQIEFFTENNMFDDFLNRLSKEQSDSFEIFYKYM